MASLRRDVLKLLRRLENEHGCEVQMSRSGHWRVRRPGVATITVSQTPTDRRSLANIISDCKRFLNIEL